MSELEKYAVLDHIVKLLKSAIADSKVESQSIDVYKVKDGNDEIVLKQVPGKSVNEVTILITDTRNIIFSEDLLETLQHLHKGVKGNNELKTALQGTTIIINDLDIETELVFQGIKDFLDQLSNSYEFIKAVENNINKIGAGFKFGKHIFRLNISNEPEQISIETRFTPTFDPNIQKTITEDINKVTLAINKMFKSN